MKVFISWSGHRSKAVADVLRRWFPSVLQAVRPYFSPDDVAKGSRWSAEIANELDASSVGLLVITPENQDASWLLFEAGALSKNLDRSKVCPLLFADLEPTDVKGPLVQFQSAKFSKEEMRRVVDMMNAQLGESALAPDVLETVFEMWWPKLAEQVAEALTLGDEAGVDLKRSERDLLEEVLALTRRISSERDPRIGTDHPAWSDLVIGAIDLYNWHRGRNPDEETEAALARLRKALRFLTRRDITFGSGKLRGLLSEFDDRPGESPGMASTELFSGESST